MNNADTLRHNIRHDIVDIVSELRTTLREIGNDQIPQSAIITNARDRLHYISTLTEQSACQTLRAAESISDSLHAQQTTARALLKKLRSPQAIAFLQELDAQHAISLGQISEIIQAQAFQDLVGQVVNKLTLTIEKMESSLAHLLLDAESESDALSGPQIHAESQISQLDIDDLFD